MIAFSSVTASPTAASSKTVIPVGTKVFVQVESPLDGSKAEEGDEFLVKTKSDITCDSAVVYPVGSIIQGRLYVLDDPKSSVGEKVIAFHFDYILTANKSQKPIAADLCSRNGYLEVRRSFNISKIVLDTFPLSDLNVFKEEGRALETPEERQRRIPGSYPKYAIPLRLNKKLLLAKGDVFKVELSQTLSVPTQPELNFNPNPIYPAQSIDNVRD